MADFVLIEKRSKKEQRAVYASKRGTWDGFNPVTRVPKSSRAYTRNGVHKVKGGYSNP